MKKLLLALLSISILAVTPACIWNRDKECKEKTCKKEKKCGTRMFGCCNKKRSCSHREMKNKKMNADEDME